LSVDSIICASSVTAKSLQVNFKKKLNYNIVPYGSRFQKSAHKIVNNKRKENKKIKLLTICHMSQRKGLHWAFKAMDSLTNEEKKKFDWTVVCEFYDDIIYKMAPKNVKFKKKLKIQNLKNLIKKSDLFILPSLIEGFGHVYLESLSLGTPILYTKNTGPNDFIINNSSCGFRVNISSTKDISLVFKKIINNSAILKEMKKKTQLINSKINWKNFRKKVAKIVIKLDEI
jgi:glycosyltransferase involved in cell wall biosynthesis